MKKKTARLGEARLAKERRDFIADGRKAGETLSQGLSSAALVRNKRGPRFFV